MYMGDLSGDERKTEYMSDYLTIDDTWEVMKDCYSQMSPMEILRSDDITSQYFSPGVLGKAMKHLLPKEQSMMFVARKEAQEDNDDPATRILKKIAAKRAAAAASKTNA